MTRLYSLSDLAFNFEQSDVTCVENNLICDNLIFQ